MNPVLKGVLTELRIQEEFLKFGFGVSIPINPASRYDMIIDYNNHLFKVQCKTSRPRDGGFEIPICSTNREPGGKYINRRYSSAEVDLFATTYNDEVYIIPNTEEISSQRTIIFRTEPAKNNQVIGIRYAEQFKLDNIMTKTLPYD